MRRLAMKIMGLGINYATGRQLISPMDEQTFADRLNQSLQRNADEVRELTRATATGATYRGEIERLPTPNLSDPRAAGWTFLLNANDPQYDAIVDVIRPLAEYRGMENP